MFALTTYGLGERWDRRMGESLSQNARATFGMDREGPTGSLVCYGKDRTVEELLRDKSFFDNSGSE